MAEMSKGAKIALGILGITPEMLADPKAMLKGFGIDPEMVMKPIATFEQIGLQMLNAMVETNVRLARIERQLGIPNPDDRRIDANGDDAGSGNIRGLEPPAPDRRN